MRPLIFILLTALLPFPKASSDELPPSILLPTREVTTEVHSAPGTVTTTEIIDTIKPGVWYLIRSKNPLFVLDSPQGSVSIISGPSSVDGIFADGDGKSEIRVFDPEESTYLIQGLKPCKTELLLIPVGVSERKAIVRQSLTVSGEGPKPPPKPDDPVIPDVPEPDDPPVPDVVKSFRVIFVKESGATLNVPQSAIPAAKVIRDYLIAKTTAGGGIPGFREYDPEQILETEDPTMKALWNAVKPKLLPAPCLVIEVNGHATVMPFPVNVDDCMVTLKKFGGE